MRETGIGTSLLLIATGAVLAFGLHLRTTGVDLNSIGAILMVIGIIGLLLSFLALGEFGFWPYNRRTYYDDDLTPPHEHRHVDTTDVIYEDENGAHVERERRIHSG